MKKLFLLILFANFSSFAQVPNQVLYDEAYQKLSDMLDDKRKLSFKEAVFTVENAYYYNELDTLYLNQEIQKLKRLALALINNREIDYDGRDKERVKAYSSLFSVLCDTIPIIDQQGKEYVYIPFEYDFNDPFGHENWDNMFLSKLLETGRGNCHSLPYLYKVLAEEIGVTAHLALAPNHTYIKHRNERDGWYNTELTSGIFPIDPWLMASGYVHLDAIRNGVYMKALDDKESIALCLVDLALGYQTHEFYDLDFVIKCANKALEYFPNYISAMMLITEAKGKMIEDILYNKGTDFSKVNQYPETRQILEEVRQDLVKIHELGYRQMPEEMYLDWLVSLYHEREKYQNKKINTFNTTD